MRSDQSRGHSPLGGLYVADPALALTSQGARAVLNALGFPDRSLTSIGSAFAGWVRSGVMARGDDDHFRLAVDVALFYSKVERNAQASSRAHIKARRSANRPSRAQSAGRTHQEKVHRARQDKAAALVDELLAYINARPGELHTETSLSKAFKAPATILRDALGMLIESCSVRYWSQPISARADARYVYQAVPTARADLQLSGQHETVLRALRGKPALSMPEVRAVLRLPDHPQDRAQAARAAAEALALDLYHAGRADLVPVGASYVLKPIREAV